MSDLNKNGSESENEDDEKCKCTYCGKLFTNKYTLKTHIDKTQKCLNMRNSKKVVEAKDHTITLLESLLNKINLQTELINTLSLEVKKVKKDMKVLTEKK